MTGMSINLINCSGFLNVLFENSLTKHKQTPIIPPKTIAIATFITKFISCGSSGIIASSKTEESIYKCKWD